MNKFLEKIAIYANEDKAFRTLTRRYLGKGVRNGGILGLGLGGAFGYNKANKEHTSKTRNGKTVTKKPTIAGNIGGTLEGAFYGGMLGTYVGAYPRAKAFSQKMGGNDYRNFHQSNKTPHGKKFWDTVEKAMGKNNSSRRQAYTKHRDLNSILKDLGAPSGGFKTKTEAASHYRKASMKHHPDRPGGSNEAMSKINSAYREYKAHPSGFEKLAGLGILDTLYDN